MDDLTQTRILVGTGGIGSGIFFALDGQHTLGREESRGAVLRDAKDYCKLHIIAHYFTVLTKGTGIRVLPVGKVGADEQGRSLRARMAGAGMETDHVEETAGAPTLFSVCFIYPDATGGNITAINSASGLVGPGDLDRVEGAMAAHEGRGIALAAPEVPLAARARLLTLATRHRLFRAASFTSGELAEVKRAGLLGLVDLLALNIDEAASFAGVDTRDGEAARLGCAALAAEANPGIMLCVTAGASGSWGYHRGEWEHIPPLAVEVACSAGAGDAYLAGILAALVRGMDYIAHPPRARRGLTGSDLRTACDYGSVVAAMSVTSPHTIHPGLDAATVGAFARANGLRLPDDSQW